MQQNFWIFIFFVTSSTIKISALVTRETTSSYVTLPPEIFEEKIQKLLELHNALRSCHHAPSLTLDSELTKQAQQAVETLMLSGKRFQFSKTQHKYGENLFTLQWTHSLDDLLSERMIFKRNFNPVISWYDELRFYEGGKTHSAEHFTQLVWRTTEKLGCGMAQNDINIIYVLCFYNPPGNLDGQYDSNIMLAKKDGDSDSGCSYTDFTTPEGNMKVLGNQRKSADSSNTESESETDRVGAQDTDMTSSARTDTTLTTDQYNSMITTVISTLSTSAPSSDPSSNDSHEDKKDHIHWLLILLAFVSILLTILLLAITAYLLYKMCKCCIVSLQKQSVPARPRSPDVQQPVTTANLPSKSCPTQSPNALYGKTSPPSSRPSTPQNLSAGLSGSKSRY